MWWTSRRSTRVDYMTQVSSGQSYGFNKIVDKHHSTFLNEKQKNSLCHHQNHISAHQTNLIFCTSLFCEGQDRTPHNYEFGFDRAMTCES